MNQRNNRERTWVDGKEVATSSRGELLVQIRPSNAGLHGDVHIFLSERQNLVHKCKVDADAAERCRSVAFEAAATAVRDNGDTVLVADASNFTDLLSCTWIRDSDGKNVNFDRRVLGESMGFQVLIVSGDDVFCAM